MRAGGKIAVAVLVERWVCGMNSITSTSNLMLERSMDFLWTKQTAILDNIANAETPNYKTKYVVFEESFEQKLREAQAAANPAKAVRRVMEEAEWEVREANESVRMDENSVNTTEEMVELVRNAFQLQHVYRALSGNISIMRAAING